METGHIMFHTTFYYEIDALKRRIKDPYDEISHKIPTEWSHDVLQMGNLVPRKLRLGAYGAFGRPAYYRRTSYDRYRIIGGSFILLVHAFLVENLKKYTVRKEKTLQK